MSTSNTMSANEANISAPALVNQRIKEWFDNFLHHIKTDQFTIEEGVATNETKVFYDNMIFGKEADLLALGRAQSSMYFLRAIVTDYIESLASYGKLPLKLAIDHSDAKILVWAEINDNDEATEDALILSEAKSNAKFAEYGFHITSTIVEQSDNLDVPPHYSLITK